MGALTGSRDQVLTYFDCFAAKSLQSCPTLCDPIDGRPPGSSVPGILQARVLEWGAIAFSGVYSCLRANPIKRAAQLNMWRKTEK